MTITKSQLFSIPHKYHKTSIGDVYFFEEFFVGEFSEGLDLNFDNFEEVTLLIKKYYSDQPFGFISNRINSYAINLSDAEKFNQTFPNLKAYAIVIYNPISEKVFELENHFFSFNRKCFKTLIEAKDWVDEILTARV